MAYRKSTLRSMSPVTRKVARLIGEQESIARRFKNLVPEIQRLELDSQALATAKQVDRFGFSQAEWQKIETALASLLDLDNRQINKEITAYQFLSLEMLITRVRQYIRTA